MAATLSWPQCVNPLTARVFFVFLNYGLLPDGTKPLDSNKPLPLAPELMFNFSSGKFSGIYLQGNNFTGSAQATNLFYESET